MNQEVTGLVAKLLATENITLSYGNYDTAWFNTRDRILGLPAWSFENKDVIDLMVGHEVGHALFTPKLGQHDCEESLPHGIPRNLVNIVEDIRIEKAIQLRYPGLTASFKRGYNALIGEGFFGVDPSDTRTLGFANRLNIFAKTGIDGHFTNEEKPLVTLAMGVKTWEDVLHACEEINKYLSEDKEEQPFESEPEAQLEEVKEEQNEETQAGDQGPSGEDLDDSNDDYNQDQTSPSDEKDPEVNEGEEGGETVEGDSSSNTPPKHDDVDTERALHENLKDKQITMDTMEFAEIRDNLHQQIPWKKLLTDSYRYEANKRPISDHEKGLIEKNYISFIKETNKIVAHMAKEFEIRKAAWENARATEAKSGTLNMEKLHSYKFTDDVFKRLSHVPDAKDHGIVMLVDWSGSMSSAVPSMIKQLATMALFANKAGIPFECFTFTNNSHRNKFIEDNRINLVETSDLKLVQLFSPDMKKRNVLDMVESLYKLAADRFSLYHHPHLEMGGTPLSEALLVMFPYMEKFKAKYRRQKNFLVTITDGAGRSLSTRRGGWRHNPLSIKVGRGPRIETGVYGPDLVSHFRKIGVTTIGFDIPASRSEAKWSYYRHAGQGEPTTKMMNEYKKAGFLEISHSTSGYDSFFIVSSHRNLDTNTDDLKVSDDMTNTAIAKNFTKFGQSKKRNRVFATRIIANLA